MRKVREMYTEGTPVWLVARAFRVPNADLRKHAWHHNWHRRRAYNLPDVKYLLTLAALTRLRDTWHLASPTSADRMLKLLAALVSSEPQDREGQEVSIVWEESLQEVLQQVEAQDVFPQASVDNGV
jgi:hypothetical protein